MYNAVKGTKIVEGNANDCNYIFTAEECDGYIETALVFDRNRLNEFRDAFKNEKLYHNSKITEEALLSAGWGEELMSEDTLDERLENWLKENPEGKYIKLLMRRLYINKDEIDEAYEDNDDRFIIFNQYDFENVEEEEIEELKEFETEEYDEDDMEDDCGWDPNTTRFIKEIDFDEFVKLSKIFDECVFV